MKLIPLILAIAATYATASHYGKKVTYEHCSDNSDIVLVLDASGSVTDADWGRMKVFVYKLLNRLVGDGVHVGIIVYSTCPKVVIPLGPVSSVDDIKSHIYGMTNIGGRTNTYKALKEAKAMFANSRDGVLRNCILVSDGMSNVDGHKTLWIADQLKSDGVNMISVGVGKAGMKTQGGYMEMQSISSTRTVISVLDYESLSDETIATICKAFEVEENHVCPKGAPDVEAGCYVFSCSRRGNGYFWKRLSTGCPYNGECVDFGDEIRKDGDCNVYVCRREGCVGGSNACNRFSIAIKSVGCEYEDECINEGDPVPEDDSCTTRVCTRYNGANGPYGELVVSKRRCPRDGTCYNQGDYYQQGCNTYTCNGAGYYHPSKQSCSFNGQCVDEGDTAVDDCDIWECKFDPKSECYRMVLVKLRCCHNGNTYNIGQTWVDNEKCVKYVCVERDGDAVVEQCITGCKQNPNSGCTPVAGTVSKPGNTCVQYRCTADGDFELVSAGCFDPETSQCREDGEVWTPQRGCWRNRCVVTTTSSGSVNTNIERIFDCMIDGQCVRRGDDITVGCDVFRCNDNGEEEVVKRECTYNGKCVAPGDKPFVDDCTCKMISCVEKGKKVVIMKTDYGCMLNGKCYAPGAQKKDKNGCIIRECHGEDHRFYPINCEVDQDTCIDDGEEHLDESDCVMVECRIDSYPPGAETVELWTGCSYEGKCYKEGDTRGDCIIYRCMGNNIWVVQTPACELSDGSCKQIGDTWFDENACRQYECRAEGPSSARVAIVIFGCETNDDCVRNGETVPENSCTSFECVNGTLTQVTVACELPEGGCLPAGESYRNLRRCVEYTCVVTSQTDTRIEVELEESRGCDDDRCYYDGDKKNMHCKVMKCDPTKGMVLDKITGCVDENGRCRKFGASWINKEKCIKRTCMKNGKIKDTVIGCLDSNDNDKCVRFGRQMASGPGEHCVKYTCERKNRKPRRVMEYTGCWYNDQCIAIGGSVPDNEACLLYTCVMRDGVPALEDSPNGCISEIDHKCYPYDHVETEPTNGCVSYVCRERRNSFVVNSAQCEYDGDCYDKGSKWWDTKTCTRYTCVRRGTSTYRVNMINREEEGCTNEDDGECHEAGSTINPSNCTEYMCIGPDWRITTLQCQRPDGSCEDIGAVWDANGKCSEFECIKVSDTTVAIEERTTGCRDNGQCYDDQSTIEKKCNHFKCDGEDLYPTQMGCWYNDKCYEIDESWTDENCVTRTCVLVEKGSNFVKTDIRECQGCRYKKKCYTKGDTRDEGCVKKVCRDDGTWGISVFKCTADDGTCVAAGDRWQSDECTIFSCNEASQSLYPVEYECLIDGKCVAIGYSKEDNAQCKRYCCVYNAVRQAAIIQIETIGCSKGGNCVPEGSVTDGVNCNKVKCVDGVLRIVKRGCECKSCKGGCADIGQVWMKGCAWHKCIVRQESRTSITTGVEIVPGCQDCYGRCHRTGSSFTHACITQQCQTGGRLDTTVIKCLDESSGNCVDIGEMITVAGTKKKCTQHGSFKIIPKPKHCTDNQGGKVAIDGTYTDDSTCTTYRCEQKDYSTSWCAIEYGCYVNGKCYSEGSSWPDYAGCVTYRCVASDDGYPKVVAQQGCKSKQGVCYKVGGEGWVEDCNEMECEHVGDYGAKAVVVRAGCKSLVNEKCYNEGEQWTDQYKGKCFLFICKAKSGIYSSRIVRQLCRDHSGVCQDVGSTYYDCDIKGKMRQGCSCNAKKRSAYNSYDKSYVSYGYDEYGTEGYQTSYKGAGGYGGYQGHEDGGYGYNGGYSSYSSGGYGGSSKSGYGSNGY